MPPVVTPEPTSAEPTPIPTTTAPSTPVSEEEIGLAALIGISAAGAVGLSVAFFIVYRKRYSAAGSAGKELVEYKMKEEQAALYERPSTAKLLGLSPPKVILPLDQRSNSTASDATGDQFVLMRVTHDFEGENGDELSAKKGAMVQVTGMVNEDWAYAFDTESGKGGIIPKQFLEDPEQDGVEDDVEKML